jgi:hypothetical protein
VISGPAAEVALTSRARFLEQLATEHYDPGTLGQPGAVMYTLTLSKPETLIWVYDWCAADAATLARNFESIRLNFVLDGASVPAESFNTMETESQGRLCRSVCTALGDWPPGEHHLSTTATFTQAINDGSTDFEPGDYVLNYTVHVNP